MPKSDLPTSDDILIGKYNRYTVLCTKTGKTTAENTELAGLQTELANYLITASDWNNISVLGIPYGAATGSANTYTVSLSPAPTAYMEGMALSIKINVQNTGASTINVNGLGAKSILKANGGAIASGNLKVNSVYTLRYNGTAFILQGEGGEYGNAGAGDVLAPTTIGTEIGLVTGTLTLTGNATDADVLASKTYYNTDAKTKRTGTMPDRGAVSQTLVSQNQSYAIPAGYHNGSGTVKATYTARMHASGSTTSMVDGESRTISLGFTLQVFAVYAEYGMNLYSSSIIASGFSSAPTSYEIQISMSGTTGTIVANRSDGLRNIRWEAWG